MRTLGIVPARGGSKGIPRKNLRTLAGRPLLGWTALAAGGAATLDRVVLSSDDEEILAMGRSVGLDTPFVRPAELARDETPGIDPVFHALDTLEAMGDVYDRVVLLQPTSPLRTAAHIDAAVRLAETSGSPSVVSVYPSPKPPQWLFRLGSDQRLARWFDEALPDRRQDAAPAYVLNGAIYVADVAWLRESRSFLTEVTVGYVMPAEASIDIDTPLDMVIAEHQLKERA